MTVAYTKMSVSTPSTGVVISCTCTDVDDSSDTEAIGYQKLKDFLSALPWSISLNFASNNTIFFCMIAVYLWIFSWTMSYYIRIMHALNKFIIPSPSMQWSVRQEGMPTPLSCGPIVTSGKLIYTTCHDWTEQLYISTVYTSHLWQKLSGSLHNTGWL